MKSFQGQVVLITVGGSEVGRFLALEFARIGARLAIWDSIQANADRICQEIMNKYGALSRGYQVDMQNTKQIDTACQQLLRDFFRVDAIVNTSDLMIGTEFLKEQDVQLEETFQANAFGPIRVLQAFLPQMIEYNHGHIVTIGTSTHIIGASKLVDYCTSKHVLMGYHESLRQELRSQKKTGIDMTLIACGLIASKRRSVNHRHHEQDTLNIWLDPEDVAIKTVRAIRNNKKKCMLPSKLVYYDALYSILPKTIADWIREKTKMAKAMDRYQSQTSPLF
jgi:all-trans-retinol dehydrogenase (NAD+)